MAHELSIREDGFVEFAFTGARTNIWHSLGNEIPENSPIELWKQYSGMDFNVESAPVQFVDPLGNNISYDDKKVLYRSDNKKPLSVVSERFKVVQPGEILDFFEDLIQMNDMKLSTAGVLMEGRRFWALAEVGESFTINGNDKTESHLLLTTSVDGSLATTAKFVATRCVCSNTINIALSEKGEVFKTSHKSEFDASKVKIDMGLLSESFFKYQETVKKLAEVEVTSSMAKRFFYDLVKVPSLKIDEQPYTTEKTVAELMSKFRSGIGNNGETAWDLLNSVTEMNSHSAAGRTFDTQFQNRFFGKNANLSTKAFKQLEEEFA